MSLNLLCVILGHKWTPGEAINEPALLMVLSALRMDEERSPRTTAMQGQKEEQIMLKTGGSSSVCRA
jgi:hypothetical protein